MINTPVVLITGALTGIGRATALAFAQEGARIVISGRRDEEGAALASELRGVGGEAEFIRADVREEDEVRRLVADSPRIHAVGAWSIEPSSDLGGSTSRSTTPVPKVSPVR